MMVSAPSQPRERAPVKVRRLLLLLVVSPLVLGLPFAMRLALEAYEAQGPSMQPTLAHGDRFLVDRTAYGLRLTAESPAQVQWALPRAGDVVVLTSPNDGQSIVKRVLGLPGDVVEWREGKVLRNGREVQRGGVPCPAGLGESTCTAESMEDHRYTTIRLPESLASTLKPLTVPEFFF